jgi:hypothetical protein
MQVLNKMRLKLLMASLLSTTVIVGCGSDKPADDVPPVAVDTPFEVTAALGALKGADCEIVGAPPSNTVFTTETTDDNGQVAVIIKAFATDFPVTISCSGGQFYDEARDTMIVNEFPIKSVVPDLASLDLLGKKIAVTTLTDLAATLYQSLPATEQNAETALASLSEIIRILAPALGENGGGLNILAAPTPVTTVDDSDTIPATPAGKYAAYLAGLAKVAAEDGKGLNASQLGKELADQITAGVPIDNDTVTKLVSKVQSYLTNNPSLKDEVKDDETGAGGEAEKPKPKPKTTGSTGSTGTTSTGSTGG